MSPARATHKTIAYYCSATGLSANGRGLLDLLAGIREHTAGWYRPFLILPAASGPLYDHAVATDLPFAVLPLPKGFASSNRPRSLRGALSGALSSALSWPAVHVYLSRLEEVLDEVGPALIHTFGQRCQALTTRLDRDLPVLWHMVGLGDAGLLHPDASAPGIRDVLRRARRRKNHHLLFDSYATALTIAPDEDDPIVVYEAIDLSSAAADDSSNLSDEPGAEVVVGVVGADPDVEPVAIEAHAVEARLRSQGIKLRCVPIAVSPDGAAQSVLPRMDVLACLTPRATSLVQPLVQAMARGIPVVVPARGAALEIVEDRISGRLFPPGDPGGLAQAITDLLEDVALRSVCTAEARRRVLDRFAVDRHVAGVARCYDRILTPANAVTQVQVGSG